MLLIVFRFSACIFSFLAGILLLGCLKKLNHNFLGQQRLLNSINKPSTEFISQTSNFPLVAKFFSSFRTDTFWVCHISFRFSDGVPLIFFNQSLSDEFQGITLNYCF